MVTFETKCWEGDWEALLKTPYLEQQIARNGCSFPRRVLVINNVKDLPAVTAEAKRLVTAGVLTEYHVAEDHAAEVLDFFRLSRPALAKSYVYSIAELVGLFLCQTPYLLHYAGDSILDHREDWVSEAVTALADDDSVAAANAAWGWFHEETAGAQLSEQGSFYRGEGFSDQCYLVRTDDFRTPIYQEYHPASERYPAHGGESFEKRVDSWMRNHGRTRLTHKRSSYRHLGGRFLKEYARQLA